MPKVKVKICGITNLKDARQAAKAGADFLGFNFYERSARYIAPEKARAIICKLPKKIAAVGVFVNESEQTMHQIAADTGLNCIQLHGDEKPAMIGRLGKSWPVIKAVRVEKSFRVERLARFANANALLLDGFDKNHRGGTGKTFEWSVARKAKHYGQIFVAGGLTPENIGDAIHAARPYAVDVCSGVERAPGKKDAAKIKALMRAVRKAEKTNSENKR